MFYISVGMWGESRHGTPQSSSSFYLYMDQPGISPDKMLLIMHRNIQINSNHIVQVVNSNSNLSLDPKIHQKSALAANRSQLSKHLATHIITKTVTYRLSAHSLLSLYQQQYNSANNKRTNNSKTEMHYRSTILIMVIMVLSRNNTIRQKNKSAKD